MALKDESACIIYSPYIHQIPLKSKPTKAYCSVAGSPLMYKNNICVFTLSKGSSSRGRTGLVIFMSFLRLFPRFHSVIWYSIEVLSLSFWNKNPFPTGINWQHTSCRVGKYLELAPWPLWSGFAASKIISGPDPLTLQPTRNPLCAYENISHGQQRSERFDMLTCLTASIERLAFFPPTSSWPVALTDYRSPFNRSNKNSSAF